jgi:hypothetical protein
MGVYLFILALIIILSITILPSGRISSRRAYIIICFTVLIIVASIRSYSVGADTLQFYKAYSEISFAPWDQLTTTFRYEWGFLIFCKLLTCISSDPQLLLFASSCLINIPIGVFLYRNSENLGLSVFLYVALALYTSNMNVMREAIAASIVLIGFESLKKGHFLRFSLFVILAAFFHRTAFICFIFLPLWYAPFNKKTFLTYIIICAIVFVFAHQISDLIASALGRDQLYRDEYMGSNYNAALIKALFAFSLALIVFNYYHVGVKTGETISQQDTFYCHMLMLWVAFSVFGMQVEIFSRMGMYFNIFAPVGISCALRFAKSRSERIVLQLLIGAVALAYFIIIGVFRPEWQGVIPYTVASEIASAFIS